MATGGWNPPSDVTFAAVIVALASVGLATSWRNTPKDR
jgi:hypothetical protein